MALILGWCIGMYGQTTDTRSSFIFTVLWRGLILLALLAVLWVGLSQALIMPGQDWQFFESCKGDQCTLAPGFWSQGFFQLYPN